MDCGGTIRCSLPLWTGAGRPHPSGSYIVADHEKRVSLLGERNRYKLCAIPLPVPIQAIGGRNVTAAFIREWLPVTIMTKMTMVSRQRFHRHDRHLRHVVCRATE